MEDYSSLLFSFLLLAVVVLIQALLHYKNILIINAVVVEYSGVAIHPLHKFKRGEIMGHHSKKNNRNLPATPPMDMNSLGQLLNNVDINAMSTMLNGIDVNQVISMLTNAFVPPTVSPSQESISEKEDVQPEVSSESSKTFNISEVFQSFSSEGISKQPVLNPVLPPNDPIVIVLNSLKPFLPSDKSGVIDDMIKLLGIKLVIDSIFPPIQNKPAKTDNSSFMESPTLEVSEALN
jgi:hypothetical protein